MHLVFFVTAIMFAFVIIACTPWHRARLDQTPELLARLKTGRFNPLLRFLDTRDVEDEVFWNDSRGLRGVWSRLADLTVVVRVLQRHVACGSVTPEDAAVVYGMAFVQTWSSVAALFEAAYCRFLPRIPHAAARIALQYHWQLTLRAANLCLDDVSGTEEIGLFL